MAQKEFKRKYMHPTRRKLADMVKTGKYDKNTQLGYTKSEEKREIGDVWETQHHRFEKKDGYILKTGKNSDALQEVRRYLKDLGQCKNNKCQHGGDFGPTNRKLIQKTGWCIDCHKILERELRINGVWESYEQYKVYSNMIAQGLIQLDLIEQDIENLKQKYDEIGEDGNVMNSYVLPRPVDEMKEEMREFVKKSRKELNEISSKRNDAFSKIKEKNYEHIL
tara:strand:+ start:317 stop:982 length:666 start_codon:yes stop_codon:yes gene_type:complete